MYIYVELWNVTQDWMDLSKEERREFLDGAKAGIQEMLAAGVENIGWAMNDEHTPHRSDYRYMAIWKMPSLEFVEQLESAVQEAGWYKYFSQANSRGKIMPLPEAMDFLINLEENSTSLID